jgi:hypothetical protein
MRFHGRCWGLVVGPQASGGGMGSPHAMVAWATTMASHAACAQQPWVIADCMCTKPVARALPGAEPKKKFSIANYQLTPASHLLGSSWTWPLSPWSKLRTWPWSPWSEQFADSALGLPTKGRHFFHWSEFTASLSKPAHCDAVNFDYML